jgi:undecaprenyl-diphosphatase
MPMLETIRNIDTQLLLFFNHLNNEFLDFIFYWISDKWIWIPFYIFLSYVIIRKYKSDFIIVIIFVAAAITISDQLASTVIKQNVMRLRPCHDPSIMEQVHLVKGYCGGKYGFISSHAANVFTLAAFISGIMGSGRTGLSATLFIWAIVVSFSRVYLGVHYPADIIVAAALGMGIGFVFQRIFSSVNSKYSFNKK